MATTVGEFGRGKTIFVLAIVIGCFAVLWPKIFYPMLTASISQTHGENGGSICCDVISVKDTNAYEVMNAICANILRKEQLAREAQQSPTKKSPVRPSTVTLCRNEILQTCGVDIKALLREDHSISTDYKKSLLQLRTFNTSLCMKLNYGIDFREIGLPRKIKGPEISPSHMRPERPFRPGPDMIHPALRERGRAIPTVNIPRRTIEREARPGPVPGMRPPVGGAGHIPAAPKGGGTMGIIMPMYTIGIVCFFLYTIMKILFKKSPEAEQAKPPVKEYGMEPEHRKYVLSEEYSESSKGPSREDRDSGLKHRTCAPVAAAASAASSASHYYEDRRRLDPPNVIYPTYPSDLETDRETTTTTQPSQPDMPVTFESFPEIPPPTHEELSSMSVSENETVGGDDDDVTTRKTKKPELIMSYLPEPEIIPFDTHIAPELPAELPCAPALHEDDQVNETCLRESVTPANVADDISGRSGAELSKDPSLCSSADTVVAESSEAVEEEVVDAVKSVEQSVAPVPETRDQPDQGPFSPLAPDQTPDGDQSTHFFDRTIVIPDYEPEAGKTRQDAKAPEEEPQVTIVDQDNVPQNVLDMADKVAERVLNAAKSELISSAPPGESMSGVALESEPEPESHSLQPRLSLETNLTPNLLEASSNSAELIEAPEKESTPPTAPATQTPPEIQVETPHADQAELSRIAEYLETLNTKPKDIEKLAATPCRETIIPIVTLADESPAKDTLVDSIVGGSSKLEITPIDDCQGEKSDSILPDICYVTQPLDESQRGREKSQFIRSSVEIVPLDEGPPPEAPAFDKVRKASEPVSEVVRESLEDAVRKLKHVTPLESGEAGEASGEKELKRGRRKSSSAHSQESHKESEIDKYVGKMAGMQETRKAMIEREMFKSSQSTQGSEGEQQQADQSSNFHGPGLLDSGQIEGDLPLEKVDKMKEVEIWATATTEITDPDDERGRKVDDNRFASQIIDESVPRELPLVDRHAGEIGSEMEEPSTMVKVELSMISPDIVAKVDILIDQALQIGIQDAVKFLVEQSKDKNASLGGSDVSADHGKKNVSKFKESGYSAQSVETLSSIPTLEPNVEGTQPVELLEPVEETLTAASCETNNRKELETTPDLPQLSTTTLSTLDMTSSAATTPDINTKPTQQVIVTDTDNTVTSCPPPLGDAKGLVDSVTALTGVNNDVQNGITEEPANITTLAGSIENASASVEICAQADPTTPPSDSFVTPVESVVTTLSFPSVEDEVKVDEKEKVEQKQEETEIIADLETIQEEIESLSTELAQMESAARDAALVQAPEEKVLEINEQPGAEKVEEKIGEIPPKLVETQVEAAVEEADKIEEISDAQSAEKQEATAVVEGTTLSGELQTEGPQDGKVEEKQESVQSPQADESQENVTLIPTATTQLPASETDSKATVPTPIGEAEMLARAPSIEAYVQVPPPVEEVEKEIAIQEGEVKIGVSLPAEEVKVELLPAVEVLEIAPPLDQESSPDAPQKEVESTANEIKSEEAKLEALPPLEEASKEVTLPQEEAKVEASAPKDKGKVEGQSPQEEAKVGVPTLQEETKIETQPPQEEVKVETSPPHPEATVEMPSPQEEAKVYAPPTQEENKVDTPPPQEEAKVEAPPQVEEAKVDAPPPQEEAKVEASPPHPKVTVEMPSPQEEAKVYAPPPEEENKVDVQPPQEEAKVDAPHPQEENKVDTPPPQEETKVDAPHPQEENKVDTPPPQEETKVDTPHPQEENKVDTPPPQEETKVEIPPPQEETKVKAPPPLEEAKMDAPPPQEETKVEAPPPQETKVEAPPPLEETKVEASPPQEEVTVEMSTPPEEAKVEASPPYPEATVEVPPPQEEVTVEASPPQEESTVEMSTPQEEAKVEASPPHPEATMEAPPPPAEVKVEPPPEIEEVKIEAPTQSEETKVETLPKIEEVKVEPPPQIEETTVEPPPQNEGAKMETAPEIEETKIEPPPQIEEVKIEPPPQIEETKMEPPPQIEETKLEPPPQIEETKMEPPPQIEEVKVEPLSQIEEVKVQPPSQIGGTKKELQLVQTNVEPPSQIKQKNFEPPPQIEAPQAEPPPQIEGTKVETPPQIETKEEAPSQIEEVKVEPPPQFEETKVEPPIEETKIEPPPPIEEPQVKHSPQIEETPIKPPTDESIAEIPSQKAEVGINVPDAPSQAVEADISLLDKSASAVTSSMEAQDTKTSDTPPVEVQTLQQASEEPFAPEQLQEQVLLPPSDQVKASQDFPPTTEPSKPTTPEEVIPPQSTIIQAQTTPEDSEIHPEASVQSTEEPKPIATFTLASSSEPPPISEEPQEMSMTTLRFETLSEPPFPLPSTTQHFDITNNVTTPDTIAVSCGTSLSSISSSPSQGGAIPLTVELLDENSPEIFPLPSSTSQSTSPVEKAPEDAPEQASPSVAISKLSGESEQASSEQQATQASSATDAASTTILTLASEPEPPTASSTDPLCSGKLVDEQAPAPPPTTPTVIPEQPPSFPEVQKTESVKQNEGVVVPMKEAQPKAAHDDDEIRKNRESGDVEIDMLRKRLEETEAAMERIVAQMGSATDRLSPSVLAQVLKARGEDLEKLIASAESGSKKEEPALAAQPVKPREKTPQRSSEKEVKFKLPPEELGDEEDDVEEEVDIVRPPTPPRTLSKAKPKSPTPTPEPTVFAPTTTSSSHRDHDELLISGMQTTVAGSAADTDTAPPTDSFTTICNNASTKVTSRTPPPLSPLPSTVKTLESHEEQCEPIVEQSAAAAIAAAKAAGSPPPSERVSVIGIEETASLISGERWDSNRTPTPTFRQPTPPVPHRPPTPPERIPSIYLEGPMPVRGQEIVVRESQVEVEGGEDYEYDDDYEPSGPVILSGKVTLSVISSAGPPLGQDELTEAPSLSLDDRAQAENSKKSLSAGGRRNVSAEIASAMSEEVRGKSEGKKSSNASSPDMDEYEVIGQTTDAEQDAAKEDTAADISTMDDLMKPEQLPQDEE